MQSGINVNEEIVMPNKTQAELQNQLEKALHWVGFEDLKISDFNEGCYSFTSKAHAIQIYEKVSELLGVSIASLEPDIMMGDTYQIVLTPEQIAILDNIVSEKYDIRRWTGRITPEQAEIVRDALLERESPEARRLRWNRHVDPQKRGRDVTGGYYSQLEVSDYVYLAFKSRYRALLPQFSVHYDDNPEHNSPINAFTWTPPNDPNPHAQQVIKKELTRLSAHEKAVVPLLAARGMHYKAYMVHKNGDEVIVRAMDGLDPNGPSNNDAVMKMVREVFPNAKFERSTTVIQKDGESCGPIMVLLSELSARNPAASAEEIVQQADKYIKALGNNYADAMLLLRKQQAYSILGENEKGHIRGGNQVPYVEKITRKDLAIFERAYKDYVNAYSANQKPAVKPPVKLPTDSINISGLLHKKSVFYHGDVKIPEKHPGSSPLNKPKK